MLEENPGADLLSVLSVDEVEVPALRRYIANDTTPASLGELLCQNQNGLLVYRDEVVSLLKSLDRDDMADGRGFYLTGWAGDSAYTFDRIGRGLNRHIPAVCLSILGSTQPGRISDYIRQAVNGGTGDDGLIQRFGLMVWPDTNGKWKDVDRYPDTKAKAESMQVFRYLNDLNPVQVGAQQDEYTDGFFLRFDPTALGLFREWRQGLEEKLRGDLHPAIESHLAKYRKLIPGLALICHLTDGGTGPIGEVATIKALAWSEYLESHVMRVYGSLTRPDITTAKAILKKIKVEKLNPEGFTVREILRPCWTGLSDKEQVEAGLEVLQNYNWLYREVEKTAGRPKEIFIINPEADL
jgi:putative DNA primase/helicase